jgi:hypothetical protein
MAFTWCRPPHPCRGCPESLRVEAAAFVRSARPTLDRRREEALPSSARSRFMKAASSRLVLPGTSCHRSPHTEPPGSGKLSHPGSPILSQAGSPILSHPGAAIVSHLAGRDRIPSSFSPPLGILDGAHQLLEVTRGGTEESSDRHPRDPAPGVLRLNSIRPTWRLSETLGWQRVVDETALSAWRRCVSQLPAAILGDPTRWR